VSERASREGSPGKKRKGDKGGKRLEKAKIVEGVCLEPGSEDRQGKECFANYPRTLEGGKVPAGDRRVKGINATAEEEKRIQTGVYRFLKKSGENTLFVTRRSSVPLQGNGMLVASQRKIPNIAVTEESSGGPDVR